jgi:histidinol-phosphate/aromatic aminotransferase/cobyric acid decarboxylase-like protein
LTRPLEELASRHLSGLIPYTPGKPIEEVEREFGITHLGNGSKELLRLAGRIFLGPGDEVLCSRQLFVVYDNEHSC